MAERPTGGARRPGAPHGDGRAAGDRSRPPRPHALHRYGQNHLVDGNILRAIVKQAAVGPDDVVLEVGAADGQLTRPLLERARLVHAFEIDHRYASRLSKLAGEHPNLSVHPGDALKQDLAALDPPPTALVANLAYNIAIPLIMTTIAGLPQLSRWAVMVQKELGDRLFAAPSTKAYAAVSVLAQLACRREEVRAVPPAAFRPQPRVDSSFITFVRGGRTKPAGRTTARVAKRRRSRPPSTRPWTSWCASPSASAARCSPTRWPARRAPADAVARRSCRAQGEGADLGGAPRGGFAPPRCGGAEREQRPMGSTGRPARRTPADLTEGAR